MDAVSEGIPGNYNEINGAAWHSQVGFRRPSKSKQASKANSPIQPITTNPTCSENAGYYLQSFSDNASIDGLKFLGEKGRTLPERIFWAVTLVVSLVLSVILIVETFNKWISSPVIVTFATSQTSIHEIPFPAITICPEVKSDRDLFNYTDVFFSGRSKHFEFMSVICDTPSELLEENTTLPRQELFDFI